MKNMDGKNKISCFLPKKSYQNFVCFSAVGVLLTAGMGSFVLPFRQESYKLRTLVIDAGHGGRDPGTHGGVAKEKHIALKIALETGKLIKANVPGVKVIFTRTQDVFIPLDERAEIANKNKADLFISVHCNANPISEAIYGTETYTMGLHKSEDNLAVANRENAVIVQESGYENKYEGFDPASPMAYILFSNYQSAYIEKSLHFADLLESQFKFRTGRKSRGVRQAGFLVLWKTTMPSVLVEVGYLSNKNEEKFLNTTQGQSYLASAIYRAFKEYKKEIEN
jgi:N-acetylmuramoyl-L-alanine amidase